MKYFPEITRIITQLREKKIEVVEENGDGELDACTKLYLGIKSGEFSSDRIAARTLYNSDEIDTRYTTLKNRLKKRLLNTLFFLDLKEAGYSEYAQSLYKAQKNLFISQTLLNLGARESAVRIAESTFKITNKFHLSTQSLELLSMLRLHSYLLGQPKQFNDYNDKLNKIVKTIEAEVVSAEYYQKLSIKYVGTWAERPEMIAEAREYSEKAKSLYDQWPTYTVAMNYFRIQSISYQIAQEFENTIRICDEAENYLDKHPHLAFPIRYAEFALKRLVCYLRLRDYENGKGAIARCGELYRKGSYNWFVFMEYYLVFALHTQNWSEAETVFNEVVKDTRFSSLQDTIREKWRIYELFLRYALGVSQEVQGEAKPAQFQFNLKQFLRNVPTYYKDKKGMNISVLIMHILYLLETEDFDGIISRMEALKTYRSRYLRMSTNRHSALFFKLLLIMESNSFDYRLTKMKAQKYYERLIASTADYAEVSEGLQILPFDWLWQRILDRLRAYDLKQKMAKGELRRIAA